MGVTPRPSTFTLRFKHKRSTILLEVEPLQQMSDVRKELLDALHQTNPTGKLNGQDLPKNPDDIKLGRPVDRHNLKLGFVSLDLELPEELSTGKGKGKAAAGAREKSATAQLKDSPQGAGLKSGDVVAFKFLDTNNITGADDGVDNEGNSTEDWDISIPTFEDSFGDDEGQDEGIGLDER